MRFPIPAASMTIFMRASLERWILRPAGRLWQGFRGRRQDVQDGSLRGVDASTHPRSRRVRLVTFALASLLLTSACTMFGKLGYDNLPTLAMWQLNSYASLTAGQRTTASRGFDDLLAWHRRTQLDDYADLLRSIQKRVASGNVTEADIQGWREEVFARIDPIAVQAAPEIAEVALSLSAQQIASIKAEFADDNEKLRKKWMPSDREDRIKVRTKRYLERASFFLGSLTAEQKQTARRMAAEAPSSEEVWYEQRLGRQLDLIVLLERMRAERMTKDTAVPLIRDHLARYRQLREGPDRDGARSSLAAGDAMSAALFAQATPKQRQHLNRLIQDWIDLTQELKTAPGAQAELSRPRP